MGAVFEEPVIVTVWGDTVLMVTVLVPARLIGGRGVSKLMVIPEENSMS
jgi:hypothetical protein